MILQKVLHLNVNQNKFLYTVTLLTVFHITSDNIINYAFNSNNISPLVIITFLVINKTILINHVWQLQNNIKIYKT